MGVADSVGAGVAESRGVGVAESEGEGVGESVVVGEWDRRNAPAGELPQPEPRTTAASDIAPNHRGTVFDVSPPFISRFARHQS